jgi:hypothetical protein
LKIAYEGNRKNWPSKVSLAFLNLPAAKSRGLGLDLECAFECRYATLDVNEIEVNKLLRACGGCLGAERR